MKMLVSLIAVCLMVAVEGSFSTHNHMQHYHSGCPMSGRLSQSHVMHRDINCNGPACQSSFHQAPYHGMESYMGSDYSHFDYPAGHMMRRMHSAGCPMKMNSKYRNFGNQVCPFTRKSSMSSYGQY